MKLLNALFVALALLAVVSHAAYLRGDGEEAAVDASGAAGKADPKTLEEQRDEVKSNIEDLKEKDKEDEKKMQALKVQKNLLTGKIEDGKMRKVEAANEAKKGDKKEGNAEEAAAEADKKEKEAAAGPSDAEKAADAAGAKAACNGTKYSAFSCKTNKVDHLRQFLDHAGRSGRRRDRPPPS